MRTRFLVCLAVLWCALPATLHAQDGDWGDQKLSAEKVPKIEVKTLATDLVETRQISRMHLLTHMTFSDGNDVFSGSSGWALEGRAHVAVSESLSIEGTVPLGIVRRGGETSVFFGNLSLGLGYGTSVGAEGLSIGFGFDLGLPTSNQPDQIESALIRGVVGSLHAYEVQLYVPAFASLKLKGHVGFQAGPVALEMDAGLVPGLTVGADKSFVLLIAAKGRAAAALGVVEPFIEMGGARQIAGSGAVNPPLLVGPGVRLHVSQFFRPAFSMMFNFVDPSALMFGIDLAGVIVPDKRPSRDKFERRDDDFDF